MNAADEGRIQPSLSSRTKCHGGTLRRRRTLSRICGSSGNCLRHSSAEVMSSVRGPSKPLSDRFFVTGQDRFDLLTRPPVFRTPRHRSVRLDFDFDVHAPPVPFDLQPAPHRGHEHGTGDASNHVCRQKLDCPSEGSIRNRLGAVRIPTPRELLQFAGPLESMHKPFRQITPGRSNRYPSDRPPRRFLRHRSDERSDQGTCSCHCLRR